MKILVTGADGFIARNLIAQLKNIKQGNVKNSMFPQDLELFLFDIDTSLDLLDDYTCKCDFVYHLAGVNRPTNQEDFTIGNYDFTMQLLDRLKKHNNKSPILMTSSVQASLDNLYGKSKKAGEDVLLEYAKQTGVETIIYRLPNVFGKWCRPNYNSVVATFCNNIANDLPIQISHRETTLQLVYIDDVVNEFIRAAQGKAQIKDGFAYIPVVHSASLGTIADLIYSFKASRVTLNIPNLNVPFEKALYSTYLSYLPSNNFSYPLKMNMDDRGSFSEIIRTMDRGQFSANIIKPGIIKGNHWHHTKNEKFVVLSGFALIKFRKIGTQEILEYSVSGQKIEVVDIPVGYTHNIQNIGCTDLVTVIWCNECFDPQNPDTYFEEV